MANYSMVLSDKLISAWEFDVASEAMVVTPRNSFKSVFRKMQK
jgi:hypothetical protein